MSRSTPGGSTFWHFGIYIQTQNRLQGGTISDCFKTHVHILAIFNLPNRVRYLLLRTVKFHFLQNKMCLNDFTKMWIWKIVFFGVFLAFLGKTVPLQPDYPLDSWSIYEDWVKKVGPLNSLDSTTGLTHENQHFDNFGKVSGVKSIQDKRTGTLG